MFSHWTSIYPTRKTRGDGSIIDRFLSQEMPGGVDLTRVVGNVEDLVLQHGPVGKVPWVAVGSGGKVRIECLKVGD